MLKAKNPYANSKVINERISEIFSEAYNINFIGLRFFTVYGPWGRPDMALFKFTESILNDKPIDVYNYGDIDHDNDYTAEYDVDGRDDA